MKKAILVGDYASVEELNKLFKQGYTVESVDDHSVYILERDELKAEPIKTTINLDTNAIKKSIEKTVQQIRNTKDDLDIYRSLATSNAKQPHVRIEFDDIRDVPKVWVDGELIGDGADDKPLVSLKVDWNTNTQTINHKGFDINYYDLTGEFPMRRGFREGTPK